MKKKVVSTFDLNKNYNQHQQNTSLVTTDNIQNRTEAWNTLRNSSTSGGDRRVV